MSDKELRQFFDKYGFLRDTLFSEDPILGYEQRMRQKAVASLISGEKYSFALDAGCGNGRDFGLILSTGLSRLVGMDFSLEMLRNAKQKIQASALRDRVDFVVGDVTHLPFRNSVFDLISCSEVLEHVPLWKRGIAEFKRVTKLNGALIVSTPNKFSMYGLTLFVGKFLFGSIHPYDDWKSFPELGNTLRKFGFRFAAGRGACYLPGHLSYYKPFKTLLTKVLANFQRLEIQLYDKKPWMYFGYMIVIKGWLYDV